MIRDRLVTCARELCAWDLEIFCQRLSTPSSRHEPSIQLIPDLDGLSRGRISSPQSSNFEDPYLPSHFPPRTSANYRPILFATVHTRWCGILEATECRILCLVGVVVGHLSLLTWECRVPTLRKHLSSSTGKTYINLGFYCWKLQFHSTQLSW